MYVCCHVPMLLPLHCAADEEITEKNVDFHTHIESRQSFSLNRTYIKNYYIVMR